MKNFTKLCLEEGGLLCSGVTFQKVAVAVGVGARLVRCRVVVEPVSWIDATGGANNGGRATLEDFEEES